MVLCVQTSNENKSHLLVKQYFYWWMFSRGVCVLCLKVQPSVGHCSFSRATTGIIPQFCDKHLLLNLTCPSPLPPCSLLGDAETSPWGAKKQTAHDFWPGHESCSWTTGAASARGKRELPFGESYTNQTRFCVLRWMSNNLDVLTRGSSLMHIRKL